MIRLVAPGVMLLAMVGFVCPAFSQGRAPLPTYEAVVQQFVAVAFGHEHGRSRNIIQKWSAAPSIAYFVRPRFNARPHMARIAEVLADVDALTGLSITPASSNNAVTLRFGFYPRADFQKLPIRKDSEETRRFLSESACIALAISDPDRPGTLTTGAIVVGTDISGGLQSHCILEELVQVLGLPNDACLYRPSLFCESDMVNEMTGADRVLLAALYDDRITSGMSQLVAMPLIREVISELYAHAEEERDDGGSR